MTSDKTKTLIGGVLIFLLMGIFLSTLPELFIFLWILIPILTPFISKDVSGRYDSNLYGGIVVFNFLVYWWGLGDMVKESFGEKYIKGFNSYSYDQEMGRYDQSFTTYEFYIPDVFWSNIYDWFGTFFFIYSICCWMVFVQFIKTQNLKKELNDKGIL